MADATTRLTISAQVKGMSDAVKDSNKLKDSLEGIGKGTSKASGGIKNVLKGLRKELRDSIKDSEAMGHAYEAQSKQLKRLQKEYDLLAGAIRKTRNEKAEDKREDAKPSRAASFASRIGSFFRGGRGGGGSGGGTGGGDGTGPVGPGSARGSFQQGLLQGITPQAFIQRGPGAFSQAAGSAVGSTIRNVGSAGLTLLGSGLSGSQAAVNALSQLGKVGGIAASGLQMSFGAAQQEASAQRGMASLLPFVRQGGASGALSSLNDLRSFVGPAGRQLGGLSRTEAAGMIGQMAASGGGLASSYTPQTIREALSGQAGLGIDVGTSGILARGAQLGASNTQGGSALGKSIADAVSLNLQGSELVRYVQGIAGNIERFGSTGIKVDTGAQGSIGRLLQAQGGYSGVRAASLSGGVSATLDSVAGEGAQNSGQFLLLQAAGFDPKDPESYYAAQERIDNASPGERAAIFARAQSSAKRGLAGMTRLGKGAAYRNIASQFGENLRIGEAIKESQSSLSSGQTSAALSGPSAASGASLAETAAVQNTFQSSKDMAQMADLDSSTGQKYLPQMLQMDAQARKTLNALSSAGSKVLDFAAKAQELGSSLVGMTTNALGITSTGAPQ